MPEFIKVAPATPATDPQVGVAPGDVANQAVRVNLVAGGTVTISSGTVTITGVTSISGNVGLLDELGNRLTLSEIDASLRQHLLELRAIRMGIQKLLETDVDLLEAAQDSLLEEDQDGSPG